jgi:hypothetical protein
VADRRPRDHGGTPAYLEASSSHVRDLYLRHGYTLQPGAAFRLPEGPLLWPMWREPRARSEGSAAWYEAECGHRGGQEISAQGGAGDSG